MRWIDLNADLGEGAGTEAAMMPWISSVNIACGGHAGDAGTMRAAAELAAAHAVRVGAHPGYADRAGLGRRELGLPPAEIGVAVEEQVRALVAVVGRLTHVKPHGALYNRAAREAGVARAVAEAVARVDGRLELVGLAGSELLVAGRAAGLRVRAEGFADRAYRSDGMLVPRGEAGAVLKTAEAAAAQGLAVARSGRVDTLCLHGDGVEAVAMARALHEALVADGWRIGVGMDTERI